MRALTHCVPLVVEALRGVWFHRRIQASHAVCLDGVGASDRCRPISVDNVMFSQKDVASQGHSLGESALSHGPLAPWVEDLAMADGERGYWPPCVGELWDATTEGSSESASTVDHRVQISKVEVQSAPEGKLRCWPSGADELIVFVADVAVVGHSASESTDGARSHHFLLNNQECATAPT
jgi:hypothetical protein